MPATAGKYHDYFTSALPGQQKGKPIGISITGNANVITGDTRLNEPNRKGMTFQGVDGGIPTGNTIPFINGKENIGTLTTGTGGSGSKGSELHPNNLYADMSSITAVTINELRNAITLQQMLELDARGGTRYTEYVQAHFGVHSADARLQRSEYLGGLHQPIAINQALQTSSTDATTPQANLAA